MPRVNHRLANEVFEWRIAPFLVVQRVVCESFLRNPKSEFAHHIDFAK
jgi:hypothetical protein